MSRFSLKRIIFLLVAAGLLTYSSQLLPFLAQQRIDKKLITQNTMKDVPPSYALTDGLLGGFRGFLISYLWQRAANKKNAGQYYEMVDIYRMISTMEPNYPNAWAFMAWDLSYNVAAEFNGDPQERIYWIFKGINMLQNSAIRYNPRVPRLYFELSWIYFNKATNSVDPAYPLYRQYIAIQMSEVLWGPGDSRKLSDIVEIAKKYPDNQDALLALPGMKELEAKVKAANYSFPADVAYLLAARPKDAQKLLSSQEDREMLLNVALWYMNKQLKDRLNMSASVMLDLNNRFGDIDWRLPQAASLYWAWLGQEQLDLERPGNHDIRYQRMIYFSLIQLAHKGSALIYNSGSTNDNSVMSVIGTPNPAMVDKTITYIEEILKRYSPTSNVLGIKSGFENFLRITIFNYYLANDKLNAQRMLSKLLEFTGDKKKYDIPLNKFISREMRDFVEGIEGDRSINILAAFCNRAYQSLADGDLNNYKELMSWVIQFYKGLRQDWMERVQGTFDTLNKQQGMPNLDQFRAQIVLGIFAGYAGFTEKELNNLENALPKVSPEVWELVEQQFNQQRQQQLSLPKQNTENKDNKTENTTEKKE